MRYKYTVYYKEIGPIGEFYGNNEAVDNNFLEIWENIWCTRLVTAINRDSILRYTKEKVNK